MTWRRVRFVGGSIPAFELTRTSDKRRFARVTDGWLEVAE